MNRNARSISFDHGLVPSPLRRTSRRSAFPVVTRALHTLGDLLGLRLPEMERLLKAAHFHDWQADSYSRGAYSYVKAGAVRSPEILGRPLQETLFFAGEATDTLGNNGTVHGAIASARRAVAEIKQTL